MQFYVVHSLQVEGQDGKKINELQHTNCDVMHHDCKQQEKNQHKYLTKLSVFSQNQPELICPTPTITINIVSSSHYKTDDMYNKIYDNEVCNLTMGTNKDNMPTSDIT